jgi:hypothetical protein
MTNPVNRFVHFIVIMRRAKIRKGGSGGKLFYPEKDVSYPAA